MCFVLNVSQVPICLLHCWPQSAWSGMTAGHDWNCSSEMVHWSWLLTRLHSLHVFRLQTFAFGQSQRPSGERGQLAGLYYVCLTSDWRVPV